MLVKNIGGISILKKSVILLFLMLFISSTTANVSVLNAPNEKSIIDIAKIYHASLTYIFKQQLLINSDSQNKEALFGQPFINNIKTTYQDMYSIPFPKVTNEYIDSLLTLMILVMEDNRTLLLDTDIGFKGFIPTIFAFQLSQKFKQRGYGINIKFTNFEERIRNKLNSPDYWEQTALARLKEEGVEEVLDNKVYFKGNLAFRYMKVIKVTSMCLSCHGTPQDNPFNRGKNKNQWSLKDNTGFRMEGWKLGEIGGAISVVLYLNNQDIYEKK